MAADVLLLAPMADYPNRIRELRLKRGWSQEELATRVGCSKVQISGLERGRPRLDVDWMRRIADALGVFPVDLLGRDDNPLQLTASEHRLLMTYRHADDGQRGNIERVAEALTNSRAEPFRQAS